PSGWVQAGDRRWYPYDPPETAEGYARKFEVAHGRTATVLALGRSPDDDDTGEQDALAWSYDEPAHGPGDEDIEEERRRPPWVLFGLLAALLVGVVGVVRAQPRAHSDGESGPTVGPAPPSS